MFLNLNRYSTFKKKKKESAFPTPHVSVLYVRKEGVAGGANHIELSAFYCKFDLSTRESVTVSLD